MKRDRIEEPTLVAVYGSGALPLDMLRYDSCVPHEETDSREVDANRVVVLRCYAKMDLLTPGRWQSFGWRVLETKYGPELRYGCGVDARAALDNLARTGQFVTR